MLFPKESNTGPGGEKMGGRVKIQRGKRGTAKSFCVNPPAAIAEAAYGSKSKE